MAAKIASVARKHDNDFPLWQGPSGAGWNGGITQSMIVRFLSCRERFRLKYVLGLEPYEKWNHRLGYGEMWHFCEQAFAGVGGAWLDNGIALDVFAYLEDYVKKQLLKYPMQQDEIGKWYGVCRVQFPEYVKYWLQHPDVKNRTPLMQEQVFDVPYRLPSGRTVRLRGKFDSVDLIDGGIYLQENKTKGDIERAQVERQLKFDLQTMMYLVALTSEKQKLWKHNYPTLGVRYNVVRRPLSGGKGSIRPHAEKRTKNKVTPAETDEEFFERLRRDYLATEPDYWFFRVRAEVSAKDIQVFRETCLDPILEQICWWYDQVTRQIRPLSYQYPPMNYRTPFGVYSALEEGGATEYDAFLETGSEAGLKRTEELFEELKQ